MTDLELIFKEKSLWSYLPLKSLGDVYLKEVTGLSVQMKNQSCEDLAEFLMKTSAKLTLKHNIRLTEVSKGSNYYLDFYKGFTGSKMPENTFSVINSISFIRNEKFLDNEPVTSRSASTSKVESKPPPKPTQQGEKSKVQRMVAKTPKVVEVMDIEEDNFTFEAFFGSRPSSFLLVIVHKVKSFETELNFAFQRNDFRDFT